MSGIRRSAEKILESAEAHFQGPHDIAQVLESDFPHLDFSRYLAADSELLSSRYEYMADIELRDVSNNESSLLSPTLIRTYRTPDGDVVASTYLLKTRIAKLTKLFVTGMLNLRWISTLRFVSKMLPQRMILDLETELDNGRFIVTSNSEDAALMTSPPTITSHYFPYGTPVRQLVSSHEAQLRSLSGKESFVPIRTLDDLIEMSHRQKSQKDAHRAAVQWISKDEMIALGDGRVDLSEALFDEVQVLLRQKVPLDKR